VAPLEAAKLCIASRVASKTSCFVRGVVNRWAGTPAYRALDLRSLIPSFNNSDLRSSRLNRELRYSTGDLTFEGEPLDLASFGFLFRHLPRSLRGFYAAEEVQLGQPRRHSAPPGAGRSAISPASRVAASPP